MELARVTVVLADEQPIVRRGLIALLSRSSEITVVGEASTTREVTRLAAVHRPDVLVIDAELPGSQVDATIREVLRTSPSTAVLVFTAVDDENTVVAALRAGARGYLLKSCDDGGIIRAVTGLAQGDAVLGPRVADQLINRIGSRAARNQDLFPELTAREQDVLELMVSGMRNAGIAAQLHLSPKTIANHISTIFNKLHVASRMEAVELAKAAIRGRAPLELVRDIPRPATGQAHSHPLSAGRVPAGAAANS
ncbi:DNA-binding response regulator, NarL/FixJ family, contains REC and HTH domains [Actinokineospora alba]|uniref:DNA-binding response regulator, NarL/FixJ family, contains REC and HTH domains n=1 Tax=Actinokineospora alba TaxID=504798 RepID=A0A1H0FBY3_9PSEU|nr:response regulator transcription factor [Actinokineospora alba]TDP69420.1 LuxR family two component transcriptional regulator [Actinokineospora alba]SDI17162.1 DNA-binding response regulator, NarL/FixJ family, contains REC and HTH domains [Actinokineospora alba]SDN92145.1 DNA-binding response regulator, NarL/FixJ family, contains REC and HTH domains [Actinokineospora alba]